MMWKNVFSVLVFIWIGVGSQNDPTCGKNRISDEDYVIGAPNDLENNPVGHWPWMASIANLVDKEWKHQCGATLISDQHFLSAAHCAKEEFKIRVGDYRLNSSPAESDAQVLDIVKINKHPAFDGESSYFDIAILSTKPVNISRSVRPVCLPLEANTNVEKYDNRKVELTGWGSSDLTGQPSKTLRRVSIEIFSQSECNSTYVETTSTKDKIQSALPHQFLDHVLCAGANVGTEGSCKGDSGRPLMILDRRNQKWIQIATVQGGISHCGSIDFPGIFIRLDNPQVHEFIYSIIENRNQDKSAMSEKTEGIASTNHQTSSIESKLISKETACIETVIKYNEDSNFPFYKGCVIGNVPNGNGTLHYKNGDVYMGDFRNGNMHGFGNFIFSRDNPNNVDYYIGLFKDGLRNGNGTFVWRDGEMYEGEFKNNFKNGYGKITYAPDNKNEADYYFGQFKDGKEHGKGKFAWRNGDVYDGEFQNGFKSGNGTYMYTNGKKYEGQFLKDNFNGFGKLTYEENNGDKDKFGPNYYVEIFKDDLYHGQGKLYWKNGESYGGAWENGERHGYGTLWAKDGSIIYQGNWQNGEKEKA